MVDIFDEVSEDLRAERARILLKRYGALIAFAVLLIVVAAIGWQSWRWWQAKQDAQIAGSFIADMASADRLGTGDATGRTNATAAFDDLSRQAPSGYATLARLRAAALEAGSGNIAGGIAHWKEVAGDQRADSMLRDLASLTSVLHELDTGNPAALDASLEGLSQADSTWHGLGTEARGLLDLRVGKTNLARAAFESLVKDTSVSQGERERAVSMLDRLGD